MSLFSRQLKTQCLTTEKNLFRSREISKGWWLKPQEWTKLRELNKEKTKKNFIFNRQIE